MPTKRDAKLLADLLSTLGPGNGRCGLHAYLRKHYQVFSNVLDQPRAKWTACAAWLEAKGVVGAKGQVPSAESLRQMWPIVRRDVEAAEAKRNAKASKQTNRSPRAATPVFLARPPMPTAPPVRAPPRSNVPVGQEPASPSEPSGLPPEVEAKLAAVREQLAKSDRYLGLPLPGKNR